ncbi:hypothetical protein Taro_047836, partial [Colocasia esculenta]|nr:hypothetical protein [Colocasia esculenta]
LEPPQSPVSQEKPESGGRTRRPGGVRTWRWAIVKASLERGNPTYILHGSEIGLDIDKLQMLLSFKAQGARLVESSFSDHGSLVDAVKQGDVVICAMSGVHFRSHNRLLQLKLVDAIKEASNVTRFLLSEFGMDQTRMGDAMEPGRVSFDEKMTVRKAIKDAYVSANCFADYFVDSLCQMQRLVPPRDRVTLLGGGDIKGYPKSWLL